MARSRSSSSDSSRSSRHRHKRSKKKRSRDSSRDRNRRDRSSSRERSRRNKSHKKSSRRRSRSRSRSRDRDRRQRRRHYSSSRSRSRSKSRSRNATPPSKSPSPGPKIKLEEKPVTEIDVIKRNKAIEDIEKGGFEQKAFSQQSANLPSVKEENEFEFGTAAEKASFDQASKVIEQMESEGLCHPNWFQDPEERKTRYLRYLTQFRKKILANGTKYTK